MAIRMVRKKPRELTQATLTLHGLRDGFSKQEVIGGARKSQLSSSSAIIETTNTITAAAVVAASTSTTTYFRLRRAPERSFHVTLLQDDGRSSPFKPKKQPQPMEKLVATQVEDCHAGFRDGSKKSYICTCT